MRSLHLRPVYLPGDVGKVEVGRNWGYLSCMDTIRDIEDAVQRLSAEERAEFRAWYAEYDAAEWDRRFEADVGAGRLNWLLNEARENLQAGRCTDR